MPQTEKQTQTEQPTPTVQRYLVDGTKEFKPRPGFETVLYAALTNHARSEAEAVAALLESGEYHRVAPRAAEVRPVKPVRFLLKRWSAAGYLSRQ